MKIIRNNYIVSFNRHNFQDNTERREGVDMTMIADDIIKHTHPRYMKPQVNQHSLEKGLLYKLKGRMGTYLIKTPFAANDHTTEIQVVTAYELYTGE